MTITLQTVVKSTRSDITSFIEKSNGNNITQAARTAQLKAFGHETILVKDGQEALNKYQELQNLGEPMDFVIMDLTITRGMGGE